MTRKLGPVDIDQLPFQRMLFTGDSVELAEPLHPSGQRGEPPFLRIIDTNFAEDPQRLTFDRAELVVDSHGIGTIPVTIDLTSYNAKYRLAEVDQLIRFAGAYFSSQEKQKDCRALTYSKDPAQFCAVNNFYDPLTGELVQDLREFHLTQEQFTTPLVVSYRDNGVRGTMDGADEVVLSVGALGEETRITIKGDSPYATLFQNPFVPSPSP